MNGTKILLVDDEKSLRQLVGNSLAHAGYLVELAANGEDGLEKAKKFAPDLILADIMMPIMDGYQMVKLLREAGNNSYIIFLTAKGSSKDMLKGFDIKADDYVVKPFQMPELVARVKAGMRMKKIQEELAITNKKLTSALQQRNDLINLIAHDLRNPIHVINSYTQLLGSDTLPTETIRDVCSRRSEEMLRLINNVSEMGNLQNRKISFSLTKINLVNILKERLYVFDPLFNKADLKFAKDLPEEAFLFSDSKLLGEVIDSLLFAALQIADAPNTIPISVTSSSEKLTLKFSIPTSLSSERIEGMLKFIDGGKGWNDGLDASTHLGLMISCEIARLSGGTFSLWKDEESNDIILEITLPAKEDETIEEARIRVANSGGRVSE